jgi:hypothetical protein
MMNPSLFPRRIHVVGILLLCSLWADSGLFAQGDLGDTDGEKGKTFRATLFGTWEGYDLYTRKKTDFLPLKPARSSYTKRLPYRGDSIVLYKKEVSEEGEEIYPVALTVPVPAGLSEPLMILAWDREEEHPVAKLIEFSPREFPYGTYQVVNLSKYELAGTIRDKTNRIRCQPGESRLVSFDIKSGERAPIVFYAKIEGEVRKVFGSICIHRERKRSIFLMYPETDKLGRVVFQSSVIVDVAQRKDR